jgi:diadenylate cyclase
MLRKAQIQNLMPIIMALIGAYSLSQMIGLSMLAWCIERLFIVLIVYVLIVFQNDIRRASERIRRGHLFISGQSKNKKQPLLIKRILQSVEFLSKNKIGALIVLEQKSPLDEYSESGISIQAKLTSELMCSLFWPGSPTHDGAVIIRGNEILTAGCLLPLTNSTVSDKRLGTRHMSAIGISEETDALVIVVSEETGTISVAEEGSLTRFLNREALETRLFNLFKESTV